MPVDLSSPAIQERLKALYEAQFPRLATSSSYKVTSLATQTYNCISWAATGKPKAWWWPDKFWPRGSDRALTIDGFLSAFATVGYKTATDATLDPKLDKIALYCLDGVPKHAARQLSSGAWTSKLGQSQDIQHELSDLEEGPYGMVTHYLSRKRRP
ncbi:MAG: DUF7689 domain-containing protein [Janthinobacterium lividum]